MIRFGVFSIISAIALFLPNLVKVHAFSIHHQSVSRVIQSSHVTPLKKNVLRSQNWNEFFQRSSQESSMTVLNSSRDSRPDFQVESEKRGAVILTIAMFLCLWSFSIPVELRREHWCFSDRCEANRSRCNDCVTFKEWFGKVNEYYANGGGVHFDFSIEEKS